MMRLHFAFLGLLLAAGPAVAQREPCAESASVRLINGKIHTMDASNTVVSEIAIQNGRFAAVGKSANLKLDPCTKTINLGGRTAVPGLIDNHNHIVLLGMRPGHDVRIETAVSIADVQAILRSQSQNRSRRRMDHDAGRFQYQAVH
jgi:predicted amidohydrolase YtcJ